MSHLISTYRFDLQIKTEAEFPRISKEITQIFKKNFLPVLDEELTKISDETQVVRIDTLLLDLGEISLDGFEHEITQRFKNQLREKLIEFFSSADKNLLSKEIGELDLLRYFILKGIFPWWGSKNSVGILDYIFQKNILSQSYKVREMIYQTARYRESRKRIIYQFTDHTLYSLFGILSPEPANFFREYTDDLVTIHQNEPLVTEEDRKFKKVVQELIFTYLIDHKSSSIDQGAFFKEQLVQLSSKYGISYDELVNRMRESVDTLGLENSPLKKLIADIEIDQSKQESKPNILNQILYAGKTEWIFDKDDFIEWMIKSDITEFRRSFMHAIKEEEVRKRVVNILKDGTLTAIFGAIVPDKKDIIVETFEVLEALQEQIKPVNQSRIAFKKTIRLIALEIIAFRNISTFSQLDFLDSHLEIYSKKFGIKKSALIQILREEIEKLNLKTRGFVFLKKEVGKLAKEESKQSAHKVPLEIQEIFNLLTEVLGSKAQIDKVEKFIEQVLKINPSLEHNPQDLFKRLIYFLEDMGYMEVINKLKERSPSNPLIKVFEARSENEISPDQILENINFEYILKLWKSKFSGISEDSEEAKELLLWIWLDNPNQLRQFMYEYRFHTSVSRIIAENVDDREFAFIIQSIQPSEFDEVFNVYKSFLNLQKEWQIAKLTQGAYIVFIKNYILKFLQSDDSGDLSTFLIDRMQQEGRINFRNLQNFKDEAESLEFTKIKIRFEIAVLSEKMGVISTAARMARFYQDVILHYIHYGKIPQWAQEKLIDFKVLKSLVPSISKNFNPIFFKDFIKIPFDRIRIKRIMDLFDQEEIQVILTGIGMENWIGFFQNWSQIIKSESFPQFVEFVFLNNLWVVPSQELRLSFIESKYAGNKKEWTTELVRYYLTTNKRPIGISPNELRQIIKDARKWLTEDPEFLIEIVKGIEIKGNLMYLFGTEPLRDALNLLSNKRSIPENLRMILNEYWTREIIQQYLTQLLVPQTLTKHRTEIFLKYLEILPERAIKKYWLQALRSNGYSIPIKYEGEWIRMMHFLKYGSILPGKETPLVSLFYLFKSKAFPYFKRNIYVLIRNSFSRTQLLKMLGKTRVYELLDFIHPGLKKKLIILEKLYKREGVEWLWEPEKLVEALLEIWKKGPYIVINYEQILAKIIDRGPLEGLIKKAKGIERETLEELKSAGDEKKEEILDGEKIEEGDKIQIQNAGLSLLWPFLGRFFKRLNMIEDNDFRDEETRMRGVQLTQYLVTGNTEIFEESLALNKILCGASLEMPIEREFEISEEEIALSESLIKGAIQNWEKMKGTRVQTFRETFLQREGRLRKEENYWELRVEEKSYDMLLTTLPWNLGIIKLAWMKDRLTVLWK
jgi:hypothetical protein